ncbi:hypothetical protein IQ07DRAFT_648669 [Pyrenochaeta sp. DS3sAY3a]|nr:hypothetical protein IQ07DRAFT_648669 [Pyrenochaeta sp. DS3sAY3a]
MPSYYRPEEMWYGHAQGPSIPKIIPAISSTSTNSSSFRNGYPMAWQDLGRNCQYQESKRATRYSPNFPPDHMGPFELEAQPPTCPQHGPAHFQKQAHHNYQEHFDGVNPFATSSTEDSLNEFNKDTEIRLNRAEVGINNIAREVESLRADLNHLARIILSAFSVVNEVATEPKPEPISCEEFISSLHATGEHDYLLQYINKLHPHADYNVAPTKDKGKKRCKVGRPVGKILRPGADDLKRRLCDLHRDEVGLKYRVETFGVDPWKCLPLNNVDEPSEEVQGVGR